MTRELAHEPFGWRPTTLLVTVRRYRCAGAGTCGARTPLPPREPRAKISRAGLRWGLVGIVCQHLSMARVAEGLAVSWNTANDAVLAEGQRLLIDDPARLDGVKVVGVDEHAWRHTRRGDKYVTVIIDLTPVRDGTGPSRLLDVVEGRSKKAFKDWLAERDQSWRDGIEVVAMDGFSGFKTATTEELPEAVTVMDPFHVVRLAGDALDECRRRVQQELHGHRGRKGDPLYSARRTLHTGADLLTEKQQDRLDRLFAGDRHVQVECTWGIYQRMIFAYRDPDRAAGPCRGQVRHQRPHRPRPAAAGRTGQARPDPVQARRGRPGLLRPAPHQQRTYRSHQRPTRAPARPGPRLPQPHPLHRLCGIPHKRGAVAATV